MIAAVILLVVALGSLLIALGMNRHHETVFGAKPSSEAKLKVRLTGSALLLASVACSIAADGVAIGMLQWIILSGIAATAISFALPAFENRTSAHRKQREERRVL